MLISDWSSYVCSSDLDLDVNGHINNVAFAELFEGGRVMLNRQVDALANRPSNERTVVGDLNISYLGEGNFPDLVHIASGLVRLGRTSWTIHQAMVQNGRIIATCDTVSICSKDGQNGRAACRGNECTEGEI